MDRLVLEAFCGATGRDVNTTRAGRGLADRDNVRFAAQ
jgi:hypothetical protein